ncbi:pyrin domain-containing protein 3-like [Myotis lucifugus]|uniref:pyrin domain-containing protein 3-like n=1 Tax=Myotis lucifugus TaxID=59463 RepID=UPI0006D72D3B|nr:pyrin domain-containing protein 3-like [Myotis lucifugus]XP_014305303.1 pyrin domain-containing protein 3-like [Myotis lucifugus]
MDLGEQLIPPFKKLKITSPAMTPVQPSAPKKERRVRQQAKTTREASVPTWGQLKKLTSDAQQVVEKQGVQVTPSNLFLAMVTLVSCQSSASSCDLKSEGSN